MKLLRTCAAVLALMGASCLWTAAYGALWNYNPLGWFQGLALRPGMVLVGLGALVYGGWHATISGTVAADTLRDAVDAQLARHAPRLWMWLHRAEIARGDWLPGDEADAPTGASPLAKPEALRMQAGRCAEAGLHDMAKELRTEADRLDGGFTPRPRFSFNDEHYPGLVPTPVEDCSCAHCEYLRVLANPEERLSPGCESRFVHGSDPAFRHCKES